MSAIARKTPLIVIVLGVGMLFASLRFTVGRTSAASAAPQPQIVAPAPAQSGEPISNEIQDFPQLD
jgi:hypothetical protein